MRMRANMWLHEVTGGNGGTHTSWSIMLSWSLMATVWGGFEHFYMNCFSYLDCFLHCTAFFTFMVDEGLMTDEGLSSIREVWIRIEQAGHGDHNAHSSVTCLSCCWLMPCWVETHWALMAMPLYWRLIGPSSGEGEGSSRLCHDKQALSTQIPQEWWCKII